MLQKIQQEQQGSAEKKSRQETKNIEKTTETWPKLPSYPDCNIHTTQHIHSIYKNNQEQKLPHNNKLCNYKDNKKLAMLWHHLWLTLILILIAAVLWVLFLKACF